MASIQSKILIVEDEPDIREMVKFALEAANFTVSEAGSSHEAETVIASQIPDLILLDWMLPNVSGIQYAKRLKSDDMTKDIPIIMLTAKAEEENKVKGLETGADDYITKPFSPKELIARIKAVLRRGPMSNMEGFINVGNIQVNTNAHEIKVNGTVVDLTPIEYRLLQFFITHPDRVYSREQLLNHVWGGENYVDERTVDVQILRVRRVLTKNNSDGAIKTVHGVGYKFQVQKDD